MNSLKNIIFINLKKNKVIPEELYNKWKLGEITFDLFQDYQVFCNKTVDCFYFASGYNMFIFNIYNPYNKKFHSEFFDFIKNFKNILITKEKFNELLIKKIENKCIIRQTQKYSDELNTESNTYYYFIKIL